MPCATAALAALSQTLVAVQLSALPLSSATSVPTREQTPPGAAHLSDRRRRRQTSFLSKVIRPKLRAFGHTRLPEECSLQNFCGRPSKQALHRRSAFQLTSSKFLLKICPKVWRLESRAAIVSRVKRYSGGKPNICLDTQFPLSRVAF